MTANPFLPERSTLQNIQILRFFAAFWVAFYHAGDPLIPSHLMPELPKWLHAIQKGGFAGVDLFFVISGFIMALNIEHLNSSGTNSIRFLGVRFARIYAGWWPFFFLYWALFWAADSMEGRDLLGSWFLLPMGLNQYLLPIIWTLSFELYFYLFVSMLILARPAWRIAIVVAVVWLHVVAVLLSMQLGFFTPQRFMETWPWHQFYLHPLVLEFLAGFALFKIYERGWLGYPMWWLIGSFLCFIAAAVYQKHALAFDAARSGMDGYFHSPERAALLGSWAVALVTFSVLTRPWFGAAAKHLVKLGDASYVIYLSHIIIIIAMMRVLMFFEWPHAGRPLYYLLTLAAIIIYSLLHHQTIEAPLYRFFRRGIYKILP